MWKWNRGNNVEIINENGRREKCIQHCRGCQKNEEEGWKNTEQIGNKGGWARQKKEELENNINEERERNIQKAE